MAIQTTTYLDVKASEFPVDKYFTLSKKVYLFKFKKNDYGIYTVEVWDSKGENFLYSKKIVYGLSLNGTPLCPFPDKIIPLNIDVLNGLGGTTEINDSTLGNQIKLYTGIVET